MSKRARYDLKQIWQNRERQGRRRSMRAVREHSPLEVSSSGRPRVDRFRQRASFVQNGPRRRYDFWRGDVHLDFLRRIDAEKRPTRAIRVLTEPKGFILCVIPSGGSEIGERDIEMFAAAEALRAEDVAVLAITTAPAHRLKPLGVDRYVALPGQPVSDHALVQMLDEWVSAQSVNHILLPDTVDGRHIARQLAVKLGTEPVLGAHSLSSKHASRRGFGDQNDVRFGTPRVLTVRAGTVSTRFEMDGEARAVDEHFFQVSDQVDNDVRVERQFRLGPNEIALEEAPIILSAGAGVVDLEAFKIVADRLSAAIGATRVLCDRGDLPRDRQIGASGRVVSADLYVAFGLSGATQHLQGIEKCGTVIAINTDAAAPIFKRADIGLRADANAVLKALGDATDGESQS